jgi:flagellar motor component MotA
MNKRGCCFGQYAPVWGIIVLIIGILFLMQDLGTWNFLGINWWTIVFILAGISMFFKSKK